MPRPRSFDETEILDRAVQLFWERGYDATSIADLEEHLGIPPDRVYVTFQSVERDHWGYRAVKTST